MKKKFLFLIVFKFFLFIPTSFGQIAPVLNDSNAIQTIIGEAANQGYNGMLGVADVIRNRNSLKGLYGFNNPIVNKQPQWVFDRATRAWAESKTNDITKGATHFENVKAFGKPLWANKMQITVVIKDQTFFK